MLRKLLFCWFTYVFVIVFFLYIFYPLVLSNLVRRHICDFYLLHVPCRFNAIGDHNSEKPQTVWVCKTNLLRFKLHVWLMCIFVETVCASNVINDRLMACGQ